MRATARRARHWLAQGAGEQIHAFLCSELAADGGFKGRDGESDLYYTVFGLDGLSVLDDALSMPATSAYVQAYGTGEGLDLVHLACLARCRGALGFASEALETNAEILGRIEEYRTGDGGYAQAPAAFAGAVYPAFLAHLAYEDLALPPPGSGAFHSWLRDSRSDHARQESAVALPVLAAQLTLLRCAGEPCPPAAAEALFSYYHDDGGFGAMPSPALPDLLCTATALYALTLLDAPLRRIRAACLAFVAGLWCDTGGFRASTADALPDCEYTFYGLLALGALADAGCDA